MAFFGRRACAASPTTRRCRTSRSRRRKTCSPIGCWRSIGSRAASAETLILEAGALLERLPPPEFIVSRSLYLAKGDRFDPTEMTKRLSEHGYLRVEQVAEPGEFAVRGAVFDVFPTGSAAPVRVDLFDDEIETLRTFDPQTQLSAGQDRQDRDPARARVSVRRSRRSSRFASASASISPSSRAAARSTARSPTRSCRRASSTTCRCSSRRRRRCSTTSARTRCSSSSTARSRRSTRRGSSSTSAMSNCTATSSGRSCRRTQAFFRPDELRARIAAATDADADAARFAGARATPASTHPLAAGVAATDDRIDRWLGAEQGERTLLATSSPGHREMLLELLRGRGYEPHVYAGWQEFLAERRAARNHGRARFTTASASRRASCA